MTNAHMFFIDLVFSEGSLIVTSYKMSWIYILCTYAYRYTSIEIYQNYFCFKDDLFFFEKSKNTETLQLSELIWKNGVEFILFAECCKRGVISLSVLRGEYVNVKVLRRTDWDQVMTNAHMFFIDIFSS
jgi:hypothetical protein